MTRKSNDSMDVGCGIRHPHHVPAGTLLLSFVLMLCFALMAPACDDPAWGSDAEQTDLQARILDLEARLDEAELANEVQSEVIGLMVREIYELSYTAEILADEVGMLSGPATSTDDIWPGIDVSTLTELVEYDPHSDVFCPTWAGDTTGKDLYCPTWHEVVAQEDDDD